ncbi:MAG: CotH kinase family protein [Treponema sp.]|nr:CotH kinase family protein [Treponema sp.]
MAKKLCFSICFLLAAVFFLFLSCNDADTVTDGGFIPGIIDAPIFSRSSGLYPEEFDLTLIAPDGTVIYYSIDGSIPDRSKEGNGRVFRYDGSIRVQNRNGQPNLLATPENTAKFFGHVDDPRGFMPDPYIPTNAQVPKATVIRAVAVNANGVRSDPVTRTFFIGDNLAEYGNNPVISIVTDPYNLLDESYGIYVRGRDTNRWFARDSSTGSVYNFNLSGRDREREIRFELFDGQRNIAASTGAGIRVRGGYTRAQGQKSFNLYFRSEYGISDLNYHLIPGAFNADRRTPTTRYRDFILRSGGQDAEMTKLRDVYQQSLFRDRNFATQAGIPGIVYLNGEYWGVYNIQERFSDRYVEYKNYAVNRSNVIIFTPWELDEGINTDWAFFNVYRDFQNMDFSVPANYEIFCNTVDIQSYIDYFAAQIYIHNWDWPQNNFRMWRVRTPEAGPYGDGKWRFMMYDTDISSGIYDNGSITGHGDNKDAFRRILDKDDHSSRIFQSLVMNNDFSRQFVMTMMDLYNVNFEYDACVRKLDEMAAVYRPLMPANYARFGQAWKPFDSWINDMKTFFWNIRSAMTEVYLPEYFSHIGVSAGNLSNVTLVTSDSTGSVPNASVRLNTITPDMSSGRWTGKYYSNMPVTVTAAVPAGYKFSGWTVTGGTAADPLLLTTEVAFSGDVTINANYELLSSGISLSGNITIADNTHVNHVKLILVNASGNWRRDIDIPITGDSAAWSTTILPFSSSTQISFRIEGYETQAGSEPLFAISDAGVYRNVQSADISGIDLGLIKLSGSINLAPTPPYLRYIGIRVLAGGKILGQTFIPRTDSAMNWWIYVPSQTASTPVSWNFYGFTSSHWAADTTMINENFNVGQSSIHNVSVSGISVAGLTLTNPPLAITWGNTWASPPAAINHIITGGEYIITATSAGTESWHSNARFNFTREPNARYVYSFYARTEAGSGNKAINTQYYWNGDTGQWMGQGITLTETKQLFTIYGSQLPSGGDTSFYFHFGSVTGTFYISDLTIVKY